MGGGKQSLIDLDKAHVWHPFTQMQQWLASEPLIVERAEGCELIDMDGNHYIDGVSSLWVTVHGHRVPQIDQAITDQLGRVAHSTLLGLSNVPSIELAGELVRRAPAGVTKVFYSEAGACAVEVGLKMAFGYWQKQGKAAKRTFVSLDHSYHGDTLGAVSVGGIGIFHDAYKPLLFDTFKVPSPNQYRSAFRSDTDWLQTCLRHVEETLAHNHDEICGLVVEPLVQAAGGMLTAPDGYLAGLRGLCDQFKVLLIVDEVATGIGRTGTFFACEQEGVSPDILVAGKGLTGGYLPLAVTMTTQKIFDAFLGEHQEFKALFHGHTYTGNPLACAAALANLELMEQSGTLENVRHLSKLLQRSLEPLGGHPHVGDIRQRGLMCGIELVEDAATGHPFDPAAAVGQKVAQQARDEGVIIRPLGDVIVLMPPLAISDLQLQKLVAATSKAIDKVTLS